MNYSSYSRFANRSAFLASLQRRRVDKTRRRCSYFLHKIYVFCVMVQGPSTRLRDKLSKLKSLSRIRLELAKSPPFLNIPNQSANATQHLSGQYSKICALENRPPRGNRSIELVDVFVFNALV